MQNNFIFFILILTASCFNNLIIPYVIYYYKFGFLKKRPDNFIGVNFWGIIMDGILAGLINIFTLNYLLEIKPIILRQDIVAAGIIGTGIMIACHIYMSVRKWKVWIMPKPWRWNLAGYWHMVSMSLQMSYMAYLLVLIIHNPALLYINSTKTVLLQITLLSFLFLYSLHQQTRGLRIGKLFIGNKPW